MQLSNEDLQAWTIRAVSGGTSPIDYGFWIIGCSKDGQFKEFVSPDILRKQGMPIFDEKIRDILYV